MKLTRPLVTLTIIAVLLAGVFVFSGCGPQVSSDSYSKLMSDGTDLAKKAEATTGNGDKIDFYTKSLSKFSDAARKGTDATEQAEASYQAGSVGWELSKLYKEQKEKGNQLWASYHALSGIIDKYGAKPEEQPTKVQAVVKDARDLRDKVAEDLDKYNRNYKLLGIVRLYPIMDFLVNLTGKRQAFSYWFAIIIVTFIVKLAITPLTKAQFKAMKEMQKISPLVKEIQEKYKGDQTVIGQKTMDLYKEHGINPFASCLPMLVQMPILLCLYYMIRSYQFQFEHGTFLWIGSALSHMKSFNVPVGAGGTVWVTARNLAEPDLILVVLYVISMYISTKLSNVDPTQAEQQKMMSIMMPLMFAFLFAGFPSAFLLYWLVFNVIQTVQQYLILHRGNEMVPATGPATAPETPKEDRPQRPRRRRRR